MVDDHSGNDMVFDAPCYNDTLTSTRKFATELLCGNALLRAGLAQLLSGTCFDVIESSAPGLAATRSDPVLYIVDATGSLAQALEFVQEAKGRNPAARVVAIANQFDGQAVHAAVSGGVDSFCLATSAREVLIKSLELTMLGERVLPGSMVRALLDRELTQPASAEIIPLSEHRAPDPKAQKLSPRETVILQSLMGGDPNKVIARKLDITEATIKVHVKAILRKIGVANRTQAAMWATGNLKDTARSAGEFQEVRRLS